MIRLLFVISSMNIGGPQKSLLALLDALDYTRFRVDVLVLRPGGALEKYIHRGANLLATPALITAATLSAGRVKASLLEMLHSGQVKMLVLAIASMLCHRVFRKNMNQMRQWFWLHVKDKLPKLAGDYDAAFGILGLSTYYIVDLSNARRKYHWIRSDTRILKRDIHVDGAYYALLDGALSVSKECALIFENMYPMMSGKTRVFHNLVPMKYYNSLPEEEEPRFIPGKDGTLLSIMRLDPLKGIEMAIEASAILKAGGLNVRWYVLGDGVHRKAVENLILQHQVQDAFVLLGFKLNVPWYIRKVDILVHPSRSEGKSNAVDEALLLGKPVIATDYPTVGDQVVHEVNGLVCPMNGQGVADAVRRLLGDISLRNSLTTHYESAQTDPNAFLEELLFENERDEDIQ